MIINKENVRDYFDIEARAYYNGAKQGFWGRIKDREKAAVLKMLNPASWDFILDAGCGAGYYMAVLVELGCLVEGIDFSPMMAGEAKKLGFNARVLDLEAEHDIEAKYDKIICAGVLEFCRNPFKVLINLKAMLKSGGFIVLLVPKFSLGGLLYRFFHRYCGCGESIRLYRTGDMSGLVDRCNLRISGIDFPTPYSLVVKLWAKD